MLLSKQKRRKRMALGAAPTQRSQDEMPRLANIPVVMYHSINDAVKDRPLGKLAFSTRQFRQHLKCIHDQGFRCITLDELYDRTIAGDLAEKVAVLTFDDGFLDNLTQARDLLVEFDAKGTIFVNPDQTADEPKDRDGRHHWGRLTYPELRELESEGTLTVQSHTLTHDFSFCSNRVVDFFTWEKRYKYHWLGYLLFPDEKLRWAEKFEETQRRIPDGYPVFEFDRTMMVRKFQPDPNFVDLCISRHSRAPDGIDRANQESVARGVCESETEYRERVRTIVVESKTELSAKLEKEIVAVCFPGGGYDDFALECARTAGYRQYIFSSTDPGGKDNRARLLATQNPDEMVGLRRISFTSDQPAFLKNDFCEYLNCKWHLDLFLDKAYAKPLVKVGKRAKSLLRLW